MWIRALAGLLNPQNLKAPKVSPCSFLRGREPVEGGAVGHSHCLLLPPALLGIFQAFEQLEPGCSPLSWSHSYSRHLSWTVSQQLQPASPLGLESCWLCLAALQGEVRALWWPLPDLPSVILKKSSGMGQFASEIFLKPLETLLEGFTCHGHMGQEAEQEDPKKPLCSSLLYSWKQHLTMASPQPKNILLVSARGQNRYIFMFWDVYVFILLLVI